MNRPSLLVITAIVVAVVTAAVTWVIAGGSGSSEAARPAYWVSPSGSDAADGSQNSPWRTIQHAANTVPPGAVVSVESGVYHEQVQVHISGNAGAGPVVFRNAPGAHPVVDGTGLAVASDFHGLFDVDSQRYVTIRGFE